MEGNMSGMEITQTIGAWVCHLPSGALFVLSGRVGAWLCGYDLAGLWGRWPSAECVGVGS